MIFLGAPGSGKGTQAKIFAENNDLVHISTGDLLRSEIASGTKLGTELKQMVDSGALVPDEIVLELVDKKIDEAKQKNGFILDGFPRKLSQAQDLGSLFAKKHLSLTAVIMFDISDENLLARLTNRRGSEGRADDSVEVQTNRLKIYQEATTPLIDFYKKAGLLVAIDGNGSIEQVQANLKAAVTNR